MSPRTRRATRGAPRITRWSERNGKRLDTDCCIVFEVEDGRLQSGREYFFDLDNWDDFWS